MLSGLYFGLGSRKEKPLQFMLWPHSDIPEAAYKSQLDGTPSFFLVGQQLSLMGYIGFNSSKHGKPSSGIHSLK